MRSILNYFWRISTLGSLGIPSRRFLGKDRRVFQRISVQIPCKMDNQLFGLESEGSTVNLSLGGMGLVAPVSWPEGSQVRVSFSAMFLMD